MRQLSNSFGTPGYSEWVTSEENWESCPIDTPSRKCLGKRPLTETNLVFQATSVVFHKEADFHDYLVISCN